MRARGTSVTISLQVKLYKDASCAGMRLHEASSRRRLVRPHCCTQTSESFFSSAWPQALKMTGRRDVVDCLVGISVCIERHVKRVVLSGWSSLSCAFASHLSLFNLTLTLRGPHLLGLGFNGLTGMLCCLRCPQLAKRGAQMLQLDGLSKQLIAVPVLWKLHSVSLDLHAILLSHRSLVGLVLRTHTMLPLTLDTMQWATNRMLVLTFSL